MNFDYSKQTSTDAAQALTAANVAHATYGAASKVVVTAETNNLRWTLGGTSPDQSNGAVLTVGAMLTLSSAAEVAAFRFSSAAAGTAGVLHAVFTYV